MRASVDEPERQSVVEATMGTVVCAPASLRWEVGNAATAGVKRRRLTHERARQLVTDFEQVTIRELAVDVKRAVDLGLQLGITPTTHTFWKLLAHPGSRCSRWMVRSEGTRKSWACAWWSCIHEAIHVLNRPAAPCGGAGGSLSRRRRSDPTPGRSRIRCDTSSCISAVTLCQCHRPACQGCDVEWPPPNSTQRRARTWRPRTSQCT
jgi:hypothetical protein